VGGGKEKGGLLGGFGAVYVWGFFFFFFLSFMVLSLFLIVVVAEKRSCIISEIYVNILLFIGCTHNMNKSSSGRFKFVGYYTVDP
jgi:hypothetical protein